MANGIDSQYTGIGRVPIIQERPDTSFTDFLQFVSNWADKEDAKKLEAQKVSDLKDYREKTLDQEAEAARALDVYRQEQNRIAQQNADTNAAKQLSDAEFKEDTIFLNMINGLSQDLKDQEILANPAFMKRQGINPKEVMDRRGRHADFVQDQVRAKSFEGSNNPLQLKYHMEKLQENDLYQSSKAAQDIVSALGAQVLEANKFQKDLYEVTPQELADFDPTFITGVKSITEKYTTATNNMMDADLLKAMGIGGRGLGQYIPLDQLKNFQTDFNMFKNQYDNRYRAAKGIGTYDEMKKFENLTEAQKKQLGAKYYHGGEKVPITEGEVGIAPDDYTLTDERFQLIEKAMEENNPLWEKWLYEEDYGFEDLKVDYEAGLKADDAGDTGTAGTTGTTGATGGGDEGLTPEQQKAIYAQGLKDNPFLTKEQTLEEFLPKEEPKQAEAFYDKDTNNWYILKDEKMVVANAGEIAKAKKLGQKAVMKKLTDHQKRLIRTRLSRIKNIQNMNYSEGEKARKIRAIQNDILAIDPNYNFTEAQTLVGK